MEVVFIDRSCSHWSLVIWDLTRCWHPIRMIHSKLDSCFPLSWTATMKIQGYMPWGKCGLPGLSRSGSSMMAFWISMVRGRFSRECRDGTGGWVVCGVLGIGLFGVINPLALFVGWSVGLLIVLPLSRWLCRVVGLAPVVPSLPRFPRRGLLGGFGVILIWIELWIGSKFDWRLPWIGVIWRTGLEIIIMPRSWYSSSSWRCGSYGNWGTGTSTSWWAPSPQWWWVWPWSGWPVSMGTSFAWTSMNWNWTFIQFFGCGATFVGTGARSGRWGWMRWRELWWLMWRWINSVIRRLRWGCSWRLVFVLLHGRYHHFFDLFEECIGVHGGWNGGWSWQWRCLWSRCQWMHRCRLRNGSWRLCGWNQLTEMMDMSLGLWRKLLFQHGILFLKLSHLHLVKLVLSWWLSLGLNHLSSAKLMWVVHLSRRPSHLPHHVRVTLKSIWKHGSTVRRLRGQNWCEFAKKHFITNWCIHNPCSFVIRLKALGILFTTLWTAKVVNPWITCTV